MELVGAEHQALDERTETGVVAERAQRGGDREPATGAPGQGRPGAAQVVGGALADADQQQHPQVGVAQAGGVQDRVLDDLAGRAGDRERLEQAEQVLVELVEELGGTGAEGGPVGAGEHGDRDDVGADDGGRGDVTDRDLRRRHLGGQRHGASFCIDVRAATHAAGARVPRPYLRRAEREDPARSGERTGS